MYFTALYIYIHLTAYILLVFYIFIFNIIFTDLNITGNTAILLVFWSTGCSLTVAYEKPKHTAAYDVFILLLTF